MNDGWEELESLCRELQHLPDADAEAGAAPPAPGLEALAPVLELLERQYRELGLEDAIDQVRGRLLGGAGIIQHTWFEYGLERLVALLWPAEADPRPELAGVPGEYRVEVWLGIGEQGAPRVRVVGGKRLEATLPVAREKFRAALLGAVRSPAFSPRPPATGEAAGEAAPPPGADQGAPPAEAPPAAAPPGEEPPAGAQAAAPADGAPIPMGPATSPDRAAAEPTGEQEAPQDGAQQPRRAGSER